MSPLFRAAKGGLALSLTDGVSFIGIGRRYGASHAKTSYVIKKEDVHPGYFKIKEQQKAYQVDNGLRVSECEDLR